LSVRSYTLCRCVVTRAHSRFLSNTPDKTGKSKGSKGNTAKDNTKSIGKDNSNKPTPDESSKSNDESAAATSPLPIDDDEDPFLYSRLRKQRLLEEKLKKREKDKKTEEPEQKKKPIPSNQELRQMILDDPDLQVLKDIKKKWNSPESENIMKNGLYPEWLWEMGEKLIGPLEDIILQEEEEEIKQARVVTSENEAKRIRSMREIGKIAKIVHGSQNNLSSRQAITQASERAVAILLEREKNEDVNEEEEEDDYDMEGYTGYGPETEDELGQKIINKKLFVGTFFDTHIKYNPNDPRELLILAKRMKRRSINAANAKLAQNRAIKKKRGKPADKTDEAYYD